MTAAGRVRLVSYNVRALKDDRGALVEVVRALRPDVLCLQEVPRHPASGHRIAALAQDCGLLWSGGSRHRMSTTLLTAQRLDVLASGHRLFGVPRPQEPRGWAFARLRLPGHEPFLAISVHLSLRREQRGRHARMLREATAGSDPIVIAGDLNEERTGAAWGVLAEGLQDVAGDRPTFPAAAPRARIDAVLADPRLHGQAVPVEVPAELQARASDHLPLAVDLSPSPS